MKTNSKIFFFLLIPLLLFLFLERFVLISLDTSVIRSINYALFSFIILFSILLGYKNYATEEKRIVWYLISLLLGMGSIFYIYTTYSLSLVSVSSHLSI